MTRLLVLGLLKKYGAMSGYDIQIGLEETKTEQWLHIKPASIYYALEKLNKEAFIELIKIEHTGNRSKAIYQITTLGEEKYKEELFEHLSSLSVSFPTQLYAAASFIEDLPKEQAIKAIEQQLVKIEQMTTNIQEGQEAKNMEVSENSVAKIIFTNIYELCEVQAKCIAKIKEQLEKQ